MTVRTGPSVTGTSLNDGPAGVGEGGGAEGDGVGDGSGLLDETVGAGVAEGLAVGGTVVGVGGITAEAVGVGAMVGVGVAAVVGVGAVGTSPVWHPTSREPSAIARMMANARANAILTRPLLGGIHDAALGAGRAAIGKLGAEGA